MNDFWAPLLFLICAFGLLSLGVLYLFVWLNRRSLLHQAEIKRLEKQKQKDLLSASIEVEETQRKELGQNFHDDVGPMLTVVRMNLEQLKSKTQMPETVKLIEVLQQRTDEAHERVRSVSRSLVPPSLQRYGLKGAMETFIKEINSLGKLKVRTVIHEPEQLSAFAKLNVFRIFQELVNNVLRHAQASEAWIVLVRDEDQYILTVTDNGIGFSKTNISDYGVGLRSLVARASVLDAELTIENSAESGASVKLFIPTHPEYNR